MSPSIEEIREVFDLRVLLEVDVLRRDAPGHTPRSLPSLQVVQRELDVEDDAGRWLESDQRFHWELYAPSGRTRTLQYLRVLRTTVNRYYRGIFTPNSGKKRWSREHHEILSALTKRDVDAACIALGYHIERTADMTVRYLESIHPGAS